ncbi:MAG: sigma-70 family RNA polymerase sigma factor [Ruminococcaceae bacterium]|nr:sigma-70 family RNA polymerase sigma factor [Oscillospiraceae bacterium]
MNPSKPLTDADIVALYLARDEAAIEATQRMYGPYCLSVAMNILNSEPDAEECVNDTYLKTWNSIPPQRPTVLRLFLGRITRNLALDRYRRRKTRGLEFEATLEELAEILPAQEEDDSDLPMLLAGFLESLPAKERDLFILRYWHGHSVARLSKAFKMKPNNLSARLYRTREKLRAYLTERGYSL